ncbi:receptor-like protein EIX1 [Rhododendron vialii]|uniref:receptor-like protein EIX1 n=1 Tax=Rhododendron vialii TaxID=182163 RepID=UPI00265D9A9D|nr:receptor-like protein EIX1 [Rhododendron vialii]
MLSSMTTSAAFAFFFCFLFTIPNFHVCFCNGISSSSNHTHHNNITCFENEREALLKFKQDLIDPMKRLSSWDIGEDCCKWTGVVCDNFTGHVREIRLRNPYEASFENYTYEAYQMYQLGGKLNPSLLNLKHLQYLDLSLNDFEWAPIPSFIGSIATLRYLNLSLAGFGGTIPPQLGNVTTMRYLDLRSNYKLRCGNLQWLSRLVLLQHLDMSNRDLNKALDWLQVTSNLPTLVELHLSNCELKYVVSPSSTNKINFTSLDILDLSYNSLLGPSVPGWILSLNHLVSLDLRACLFEGGPLPSGLQNMTSLRVLDWSYNNFNSTIPNWLYSLSHLESLGFRRNLLHGAVSIAIENLTSLVSLDLSDNQLQGSIPTSLGKLCKLKTISLSKNQLQGSIPTSLGKLCKLKTIDLSYNEFSGEVADIFVGFSRCKSKELETFRSRWNLLLGHLSYELGQLTSLAYFDLYGNSFSGPIPTSIGRLSSLISLDLSNNKFNGTLLESLGRLGKLESLYISNNLLEGVVSDVHFASLTKLRDLDAGGNNLTLNASENWVPPFQVEILSLDLWTLGPQFPLWLPSQMKLDSLSITNTRISNSIPTLFWPNLSKLWFVNLSCNQIRGEISSILNVEGSFATIDLSSNLFNGSLPLIFPNLTWLDLSNNSFSGSIYHMLCDKGEEPNQLYYLNIGRNRLSGKIPDCWKHWQSLGIIKLENNNLEGSIPSSIGLLAGLNSLHLRHNNLTGELPQTLRNCSSLLVIDLGENKLTGTIPPWMGNALLGLIVLDLRSNNFSGNLPYELCLFSSLQILDVAHNNLFGHVPRCFANFRVMTDISNSSYLIYSRPSLRGFFEVQDNAFLVTKGRDVEYRTTLGLVTSMDLSGNNLSGGTH